MRDELIIIALEVAGSVSAISKQLNCCYDCGLLCNDGLTELPHPVQIFIQELYNFGVIQ